MSLPSQHFINLFPLTLEVSCPSQCQLLILPALTFLSTAPGMQRGLSWLEKAHCSPRPFLQNSSRGLPCSSEERRPWSLPCSRGQALRSQLEPAHTSLGCSLIRPCGIAEQPGMVRASQMPPKTNAGKAFLVFRF